MNCRDFISEFEERRDLSEAAQFHRNDCPGCQQTSRTQTQIWNAIDNLAQISAPNNFEFGVKARIAKGAPSSIARPQFIPALRYVLPLSVVVLIAGLLAFNTAFFFGGGENAPQIAQTIVSTPEVKTNIPVNNFLPPAAVAAVPIENTNVAPVYQNEAVLINASNRSAPKNTINKPEAQFVVKRDRKPTNGYSNAVVENTAETNGGGSKEFSVKPPKELTPEGFNVTTPIENSAQVNDSAPIKIGNIWSAIGLEIASENGKQVVKSVMQNSPAARANVKVGDVIETVDGVQIANGTALNGKIEIKTMTVLRGDEKIEISIKN